MHGWYTNNHKSIICKVFISSDWKAIWECHRNKQNHKSLEKNQWSSASTRKRLKQCSSDSSVVLCKSGTKRLVETAQKETITRFSDC